MLRRATSSPMLLGFCRATRPSVRRMAHVVEANPKYAQYFADLNKKSVELVEKSYSINELAGWLKGNELNLAPEYQRGFVWKPAKCAKLIETVLNRRFVPPIVLHEKPDGNYDVIDGKQRLSTLLAFYQGEDKYKKYSLPECATRLSFDKDDDGDEHPLQGLQFKYLPLESQKFYNKYQINARLVRKDATPDQVFEIYEDINSGGEDLTAQQLRRAAFHSPYMTSIQDTLRRLPDFLLLRGASADEEKESDGEMILRAIALSRVKLSEYRAPMKKFLNRDAASEKLRLSELSPADAEKDILKLEKTFRDVVSILLSVFGSEIVCREHSKGEWKKEVSPWLWDGLFVAVSDILQENPNLSRSTFQFCAEAIRTLFLDELMSGAFLKMKGILKPALVSRVDKFKAIIKEGLKRDGAYEPRAFSRSDDFIDSLWDDQDGLCPICGNSIEKDRRHDGAYAQLDHIKAHSKGGKTSADNCSLVHATCNQSKGAR